MKKLMLLVMSRFVHAAAPLDDGLQEAAAAGVHVALLDGVAHHVAFVRAGAAERVVAAAGVGHDRQQHVAAASTSACVPVVR